MQALSLVRISKKQNFVEISLTKNSECKIMGLDLIVLYVWFYDEEFIQSNFVSLL